jgi:iron-sulfur cluster assembly protein
MDKNIVVNITEKALKEIKDLAEKHGIKEIVLRVQAIPGGCSGITYHIGFDKVRENDTIIEKDGIKIVVDKDNIPLVNGVNIDYVITPFGEGFKIENPNIAPPLGGGCASCPNGMI